MEEGQWIHAGYTGYFVNVLEPELKERIIVVGNLEKHDGGYRAFHGTVGSTQIGRPQVDIFAPGSGIYSITDGDKMF